MTNLETTQRHSGRWYSWYVLAVLFAVYVMNIADRQIVGILAEDIKRDLQMNDSQIGFLTGPAISFFYAILGLPLAHAADRVNRVRFIAACLAIWSVMTIVGGRTANFVQLALTRVGVSIAEAGGTPASVSLIGDYFPPHRRATAMAIWTSGSTAGVFVGGRQSGFFSGHMAATICWIALAAVVLRYAAKVPRAQRSLPIAAGMVLVAASMAKLFLFDLGTLAGLFRVIVFIVVGLVLLGMGAGYARLLAQQDEREQLEEKV